MKTLLGLILFISACNITVTPPPPRTLLATASITNYVYGGGIYYYYNDCGPVYYYSDNTYESTCTYPEDNIMIQQINHIGNSLQCPGPSYRKIEYVNYGYDMMDYTVDCE